MPYTGQETTYGESNSRANRPAALSVERGVGPEDIVAVAPPRTADLPMALPAVPKSGAAHLPPDPAPPAERVARILADARPALALSTGDSTVSWPAGVPIVLPDRPYPVSAAPRWHRGTDLTGLPDLRERFAGGRRPNQVRRTGVPDTRLAGAGAPALRHPRELGYRTLAIWSAEGGAEADRAGLEPLRQCYRPRPPGGRRARRDGQARPRCGGSALDWPWHRARGEHAGA
ncbi:AMP-binding protein [Embleya sp. AB8]|uniref:AMP-binding protein n=1 Tax=Embleya sp. AB8 TaxID=3156304 RepID=UPI003C74BFBE